MSNLTAYVPVPENSAATPGLFDYRYQTLHANVQAVDATVSQVSTTLSIVSGSGVSGFINVQAAAYGALGTGSADDRAAFVSANSSTATQAILYAPSSASVYRIGSALTIQGTYQPIRGAILRPTSGTTIYHTGGVDAGPYQIWDLSLGGHVDFSGSKEIPRFLPQWFGIVGDTVTDDQPALTSMMSHLPKHCEVYFSPNLQMRLGSTWTIYQKPYVRFVTPSWPMEATAGDGAAAFIWGSSASGKMIMLDRCRYTGFEGFTFRLGQNGVSGCSGSANVAVDIDMVNAGSQIATQCYVRRNNFILEENNTAAVFVRIANVSGANCEYCRVEYNNFYGYGDRGFGGQVTHGFLESPTETCATTSGSSVVLFDAPTSTALQVGQRFRIAGAGNAVNGFASGWDTSVSRVSSTTQAVMAGNAPSTVTGAYSFGGQGVGTALAIGVSFNAKGTRSRRNTYQWLGTAINDAGGNILSQEDNFTGNDINYWIHGSLSEPSLVLNANSENARVFLLNDSTQPVTLKNCRIAPNWIDPINGLIQLSTGIELTVEQMEIDSEGGAFPKNCRLFDCRSNTGRLLTIANSIAYTTTQVGWDQFDPTGGGTNGNTYTHLSMGDLSNTTGRQLVKVRGGNYAASNDYANVAFSGRLITGLPDTNDDTQLSSSTAFGSSLGAGSMTHRLVNVSGTGSGAATGIIERRTMRVDGTVGSAYLPVDTTDETINSGTVRDILLTDFGRRIKVDSSGGLRQPQLRDDNLPVGFYVDIYRADGGFTAGNRTNVIANNSATINGLNGSSIGVDPIGKGTTIRFSKQASQVWDATPIGPLMPIYTTWVMGGLAASAQTKLSLTIGGALVGQKVDVTANCDLQSTFLDAYPTGVNAVDVIWTNLTGSRVTLNSASTVTLALRVHAYV